MSTTSPDTGVKRLRIAIVLLVLSIAVAAGAVFGGRWYLDKGRRDGVASEQRLRAAQSRLDAVKRERDSLQASAEVFRTLSERGVVSGERRIDMVEFLNELRRRHSLAGLEYEIAPQRALPGLSYAAVDVLASRVRFKLRALHEGDALAFLEDLAQAPRGLYPVDRCILRRVDAVVPDDSLAPRVEAECQLEWITVLEKNRGNRAS